MRDRCVTRTKNWQWRKFHASVSEFKPVCLLLSTAFQSGVSSQPTHGVQEATAFESQRLPRPERMLINPCVGEPDCEYSRVWQNVDVSLNSLFNAHEWRRQRGCLAKFGHLSSILNVLLIERVPAIFGAQAFGFLAAKNIAVAQWRVLRCCCLEFKHYQGGFPVPAGLAQETARTALSSRTAWATGSVGSPETGGVP